MRFWESPDFIKKLESIRLVLKNKARGIRAGENRSRYYGHGLEISHLKNYSYGEDIKFVDWNATFRLDRTFLKVFSETRENMIYILIDRSPSMSFGAPFTKFELAVRIAYAIAYITLSGSNKLSLIEFSGSVENVSQITRTNINERFRAILERENIPEETKIKKTLKDFFARFKKRGVAFMLSDLLDRELSAADEISKLAHSHNFCLIHTLCGEDVRMPRTGEFKFEDSETGEYVEISMTPELAGRFDEESASYYGLVAARCAKYGGAYLRAECGIDPVGVVRDVVLKMGIE